MSKTAPAPAVVVVQPFRVEDIKKPMDPVRDWSTGVFACSKADIRLCCLLCWCGACYLAYKFNQWGESCWAVLCFYGLAISDFRGKYRGRHGIRGGVCHDICCMALCGFCVTCQLFRDISDVTKAGFKV